MALAAIVAAGSFMAWRTSVKCRPRLRAAITLARGIGLACLAVAAINPGRWRADRQDVENEWAIVADRSLSMATADVDGKSRWSEACRLAGKALASAKRTGNANVWVFSGQLESSTGKDLAALAPDGKSTDIVQAGKTLLGRINTGRRHLSGMILLSDGRQVVNTPQEDFGIRARAQESPVFPLVLGGDVRRKDLWITAGRKQYVAFAGQKTRIKAFVFSEGLGNISPVVRVLDAAGKTAAEQKVEMAGDGKAAVSLEILPEKAGYSDYTLTVSPWEGERTEANNQVGVGVAVLGNKMKLFMAEGAPHWDNKFVTQLLRKEPNMEMTSVFRVSADRFFKVEPEKSRMLAAGEAIFPDEPGELARYDVVLFGKGVEYFLTPARVKRLQDYVREQGGCIVFFRGKPYSGTFPDLEPLEPVTWGDALESRFSFRPTAAGEESGLFGGLLPGAEDPVWKKAPLLQYANRCAGQKAFTQVLAEGVVESGPTSQRVPLILSRRYGKGIVVTVNASGLWQWDFFPSVSEAGKLYEEMWVQTLQWAATYSEFLVGQEYSLWLSASTAPAGAPVRAVASRRGTVEKTAAPGLRIVRKDRVVQEATAAAETGTDNKWEAVFSLREPGLYRVELLPAAGGGATNAPCCAALTIEPEPTEADNLSADKGFLAKLAETSGGKLIEEKDLEKVFKETAAARPPSEAGEVVWTPAWDRAWLLLLMAGCFSAEWFIRRRNGLL